MDINELWKNIQGEFTKVNERIGGVEIRVGNLETKVENLEIEVNEIKYDNKMIKKDIEKINQRLEVIQNVNILNKQSDIMKEINREIKTNNLEHENIRYRQERIEKVLGIA